MTVRERLFRTDPYAEFERRESECNGWNSQHPKLAELIRETEPGLIVEVGTWLGASALWMAEQTDAPIVCIDTWLGAPEMWTDHADGTRYGALKLQHGYPTIYYDFLSNVVCAGKQSQITPMPMPSSVALPLLNAWKVRPGLIYIDGDHSYRAVRNDVRLALELWPRIICGDDFRAWPDVGRAVKECLPAVNVEDSGFWWLDRETQPGNGAIE